VTLVDAVHTTGAIAEVAVRTLVTTGLHGAALALLAVLLLGAHRRLRGEHAQPAWHAAVWLVVLIKLVVPWGPALPGSLADVLARLGGGPAAVPLRIAGAADPSAPSPPVALWPAVAWIAVAAIWAAGALVVIARAWIASRAALAAARGYPDAPAAAAATLAELAARAGVRPPRLAIGDPHTGPHVLGLARPTIVVPPALVEPGTEAPLLRAALLHELAHVARRDAVGRAVQVIARAGFWFFPVAHFASRRLEQAREAACDALALELEGISRPVYARLLVRMAQLRAAPGVALAARRTLDARVAAVLGPPTGARLGWLQRAGLMVWIALALGGARGAAAGADESACVYTSELAEALRAAYPAADVDGDGLLSREEACDYEAELRRRAPAGVASAQPAATRREPLVEPLCCDCTAPDGAPPPAPCPSSGSAGASCSRAEEGAER
jgi:beta-lactamase regulating signal transducer with metallopeptidase domain